MSTADLSLLDLRGSEPVDDADARDWQREKGLS
jgi:hypothetical protein